MVGRIIATLAIVNDDSLGKVEKEGGRSVDSSGSRRRRDPPSL